MKIRLRVDVSGTRNGVPWPPRGSVIDLPDDEAVQYCAGGMAIPVAEPEPVETAVDPEPAEVRSAPLTTDTGPGRRARGKN
jgi:hypothetical protein